MEIKKRHIKKTTMMHLRDTRLQECEYGKRPLQINIRCILTESFMGRYPNYRYGTGRVPAVCQ